MKIINNFIDPEFIKELHKENKNLLFENVWRSNISWQEEIISHSGTVLIRSLNETQTKKIVKALIKNGLVSQLMKKLNLRLKYIFGKDLATFHGTVTKKTMMRFDMQLHCILMKLGMTIGEDYFYTK